MDPKEIVNMILADLGPVVADTVKAQVAELGLDKVERQHNVVGEMNKAVGEMSLQEKMNAFFRADYHGDYTALKTLSEGTAEDGGYLVPSEYHAELIGLVQDAPTMRSLVRTIPVGTDSGEYPVMSGGFDVEVVDENQPFGTDEPGFSNLTYTVVKVGNIVPMSRELFEDNKVDLYQVILDLFAEIIGLKEDYYVFNGNGTKQPLGILNASGVLEAQATGTGLVWTDLVATKYKVPARKRQAGGLVWFGNSTAFELIEKLTDDYGRPLWRNDLTGDRPATLLNYPYREVAYLPATDDVGGATMVLMDPKEYWLFDRQVFTTETSREGDYFANHQVGVKGFERIDGKPARPGTIVKLTGIVESA